MVTRMSPREKLLTLPAGVLLATFCVLSAAACAPKQAPATAGTALPPPQRGLTAAARASQAAADPWHRVPPILRRIVPPAFPARDFPVTEHGAAGDGVRDCTSAFQRAIQACHTAGGGRVVVPPGRFLTAAIHLKSSVNLHVREGATILFIPDPARYLPPVLTRYEGNDCYNYSPFIYARDQTDVAITGGGAIDGQANVPVWQEMNQSEKDQEALREMAEKGVPVEKRVFGPSHTLRPNMIQFYRCSSVLIEGVTVKNAPMWSIHPVLCKNVTIRAVTVDSHVANGDGIDPESCADVLIKDCTLSTRDDGIVLKAGRNADGRRVNVPCENVVVQGCRVLNASGDVRNGLAIGSEMSAGVRNVFFEDCTVSDRLRGISFKTNTLRGGFIEDIYFRNVHFDNLRAPVLLIDMEFGGDKGPHAPRVRNVVVQGSTVKGAGRICRVYPSKRSSVSQVLFVDCHFTEMKSPMAQAAVEGVSFDRCTVDGRPMPAGL
jgi:polygalacturonase